MHLQKTSLATHCTTVCFLPQAMWGLFFKKTSSGEKGTMYQLRNVIHRTNVPLSPDKNMNAAEDFMLLMLHTHVVAAAKTIQALNPVECVEDLAKLILVNYTRFPRFDSQSPEASIDGVYLYATELLTLALIWHAFHDAIREGDGERIIQCWKFFLIIFKNTNHRNYAKEAVNILYQYHYSFSERMKAQLLWSRCVNTKGSRGANIPGDLHMEHLNRRLKSVIRVMGGNVNPAAIQRAGKAIAVVDHICQCFAPHPADHHPIPEFGEDFVKVLEVLEEENVFMQLSARRHQSFKMTCGVFEKFSMKEMEKKLKAQLSRHT